MIEIDGSGGGGQVLRSALTCSLLTGRAVSVTDVRGSRPNPGVRPQHAAAVRLAARVGDAEVEGGEVGDSVVRFAPEGLVGGRVDAAVGTAGSVTLLVDVLLPLALALDEPLSATLRGGTDVKWSPPVDYLAGVKLPLLRKLGVVGALDVDRRGFYPAGGGRVRLTVAPSTLDRIDLPPTPVRSARIASHCSTHLAEADVAGRQATAGATALEAAGVDVVERTTGVVAAGCPGSVICVRLDGALDGDAGEDEGSRPLGGFCALGERGVPAEEIGERTVADATAVPFERAVVDPHLADQLLVFLAVAGGEVWIPTVTDHVETNAAVLRAFGFDLGVDERDGDGAGAIVRSVGWDR